MTEAQLTEMVNRARSISIGLRTGSGEFIYFYVDKDAVLKELGRIAESDFVVEFGSNSTGDVLYIEQRP